MREDRRRLEDILEAINQIEKYATRGRQAFESDEMLQVWMVYHFQIIGEAANGLSPAIQDSTTTIPWSDVIGMRNILVHRYWGIDPDLIWAAVEDALPSFKKQIQALLTTLK